MADNGRNNSAPRRGVAKQATKPTPRPAPKGQMQPGTRGQMVPQPKGQFVKKSGTPSRSDKASTDRLNGQAQEYVKSFGGNGKHEEGDTDTSVGGFLKGKAKSSGKSRFKAPMVDDPKLDALRRRLK